MGKWTKVGSTKDFVFRARVGVDCGLGVEEIFSYGVRCKDSFAVYVVYESNRFFLVRRNKEPKDVWRKT